MVPCVSETGDPRKKHRHDVGMPDHGAVSQEQVTRSLQWLLLLLIGATGALSIYALVVASS
jgi:hypothetical protein